MGGSTRSPRGRAGRRAEAGGGGEGARPEGAPGDPRAGAGGIGLPQETGSAALPGLPPAGLRRRTPGLGCGIGLATGCCPCADLGLWVALLELLTRRTQWEGGAGGADPALERAWVTCGSPCLREDPVVPLAREAPSYPPSKRLSLSLPGSGLIPRPPHPGITLAISDQGLSGGQDGGGIAPPPWPPASRASS